MAAATSPVRAAVDAVLAEAVGPSLAAGGFRRRQRTWSREDDAATALVTGLAHRSNAGVTALFTLEIGVSYVGLGEPPPVPRAAAGCPHWRRIGEVSSDGSDVWWCIDDVTDLGGISRVTAQTREVWEQDGLRLVDALSDPRAFLALAAVPREHGRQPGYAEVDLLVRLGDQDAARQVVTGQLEALLIKSRRPASPAAPYPQMWLLPAYAWWLPRLRDTGMAFPEVHREVVRAAFAQARQAVAEAGPAPGGIPTPLTTGGLTGELIVDLAREVGGTD